MGLRVRGRIRQVFEMDYGPDFFVPFFYVVTRVLEPEKFKIFTKAVIHGISFIYHGVSMGGFSSA